ncbi:hypothetical protein [Pseudochelatococcus sp. G4_1912]|uniref:hypothetical protein n=1 Tax=Pseudochelatococcus sp. G4_1912 TaxID=3114288 RepID=UPI0039C6214E
MPSPYTSPALTLIERFKSHSQIPDRDAAKAFEAIQINIAHSARLAEIIAKKSADKAVREQAGFACFCIALANANVEQALEACLAKPSSSQAA